MSSTSSSTSSSRSSSTSTSTSTSKSGHDPSNNNLTIGLAVGLGVGIPIFLTIVVLIWVTARHRRKLREEDEMDKDIDFNGDVSFWSPGQRDDLGKFGVFESSLAGGTSISGAHDGPYDRPGFARRDTHATSQLGADAESTNLSEVDALSQSEHTGAGLSHLYTPELGFTQGSQENFSRAIHNVYGPSPAYPSSEKLRAPSFNSFRGHQYAGSISSQGTHGTHGTHGAHGPGLGPFATPPRPYNPSVYSNSGSQTGSQTGSLPGSAYAPHGGPHGGPPDSPSAEPAAAFTASTHPYADHYRRNSDASVLRRSSIAEHTPGARGEPSNGGGPHGAPPHAPPHAAGAGALHSRGRSSSSSSSNASSHHSAANGGGHHAGASLGAQPDTLTGVREAPHPYQNFAGAESAHSLHTAASRAALDGDADDSTSDPSSPLRGAYGERAHQPPARDRHSSFAFDP